MKADPRLTGDGITGVYNVPFRAPPAVALAPHIRTKKAVIMIPEDRDPQQMKWYSRFRKDIARTEQDGSRLFVEALENRILLSTYTPNPIYDPYAVDAVSYEDMLERASHVAYMPGELVVAIQLPTDRQSAQAEIDRINWQELFHVEYVQPISTLQSVDRDLGTSVSLVHLDVGDNTDVLSVLESAFEAEIVNWASPNFFDDSIDPREFIPNDPHYGGQYHHPLMSNDLAWDTTLGDPSIIIGVTDDGVEINHSDLNANIWVNAGEIPGNGIDDDGNGYIDDVNGWDFINGNNDPNPDSASFDHGTHVAGIAAGRTNNAIGIAGVAGHSTIMPLQFYNGSWNAAEINETFTYGTDNGARIITTSYNINGWVGDPVFTAGMQYMYDGGVLHTNSAGNGNEFDPARIAFHQTLLVVSTDSNDLRSSFSNYGTGVDISAPGSSVFSTVTNDGYGTKSGTSMAAPNAAGVAALIWSNNPTWTRDQVAAQLLATADDIDALNPGYEGWLGSGRVNSHAALTTTIGAPQVSLVNGIPEDGGSTSDLSISNFEMAFSQIMDPASVNDMSNFELRSSGADGIFGNGDDVIFALSPTSPYMISTNRPGFDIVGGPLSYGEYQFTAFAGPGFVGSGLQNPFGTALDGDGDGTPGDDFVTSFVIEPPPPTPIAPFGSLIYTQQFPGAIAIPAETDDFGYQIDAGQTLTVLVEGSGVLVPTIEVRDPNGTLIADVTGTGQIAHAQVLNVGTSGNYIITIGGDSNTTGAYSLTLLLNSGIESELLGGPDNDSMANAENIDFTALALGGSQVDRMAMIGELPTSDGVPVITEDFESGSLGPAWTTSSSAPEGRIQVTGAHGTAGGNFALLMDVSVDSTDNLNEAIWTIDLSTVTDPTLSFYHAEWSDEETPLPTTFVGSFNGDGVAISEDGVTWHTIFTPTTIPAGSWEKVSVDLVDAANNAGITLGPDFRIKFQQFDNFTLETDGRGYDEISINEPVFADDWYAFSLADGEVATIAATRYGGDGTVDIELYDAAGTLKHTGVAGSNVSSVISQFVDPTSNGTVDTYFVKVAGVDVQYSLLALRNADFDLEPNDVVGSEFQDITGLQGVLGYVATDTNVMAEPDDFNDGDVLDTAFAGVTLTNDVTSGSVFAAAASFGAPTGSLVFAPAVGAASGWSSSNILRGDFDELTSSVSIVVGSDDSSDVGYLRAWSTSGTMLEEVTSGSIPTGGSEVLTINRASADIAYFTAAGVGGDVTPMDLLSFGAPGSDDVYGVMATAGEELNFNGILPGEGPFLFDNGLDTESGNALRLDLIDPNGTVVVSGATSISHTAALTGNYQLRVYPDNAAGEYFIQMGVPEPLAIETGNITKVRHIWQTILFESSFVDPIVMVGPATMLNADPGVVRIRNVTSTGFEIQFNSWDYLGDHTAEEQVGYMVIERGTHILDNGTVLVADSISVDEQFAAVNFGGAFNATPVVLATVASTNGGQAVTTRMRNAGADSIEIKVQEEEANDDNHTFETVNYFAIEAGIGVTNGFAFEAGFASVSDAQEVISYTQSFSATPAFLASIQTYIGANTATLRMTKADATFARTFVDEESSADAETNHTFETVGYLAIRGTASGSPLAGQDPPETDLLSGLESVIVLPSIGGQEIRNGKSAIKPIMVHPQFDLPQVIDSRSHVVNHQYQTGLAFAADRSFVSNRDSIDLSWLFNERDDDKPHGLESGETWAALASS